MAVTVVMHVYDIFAVGQRERCETAYYALT